jgi:hypothetical protein
MKTRSIALALALLGSAAVATAQTAPPAHAPSGSEKDVNSPDVAAANQDVAAQAAAREGAVAEVNAETQASADAQYTADLAAYRDALRAHHREVRRDARIADRQERAYADAMRDWRRQVYACKHGSSRACKAPSPNPADYW